MPTLSLALAFLNCGKFSVILTSSEGRERAANDFLSRQAARSLAANGISKAVTYLVHARGCCELNTLADGVGLSSRHFARRFIEQAGVSPKLFAKIVRFQAALETKALCAAKSWTEIAHQSGYYDQMHMIHDFEQLRVEARTDAGSP